MYRPLVTLFFALLFRAQQEIGYVPVYITYVHTYIHTLNASSKVSEANDPYTKSLYLTNIATITLLTLDHE